MGGAQVTLVVVTYTDRLKHGSPFGKLQFGKCGPAIDVLSFRMADCGAAGAVLPFHIFSEPVFDSEQRLSSYNVLLRCMVMSFPGYCCVCREGGDEGEIKKKRGHRVCVLYSGR